MTKISIETIKAVLPEKWELRSSVYKNLDTLLTFACPEGHEIVSTWKKMRQHCDCPICAKTQVLSIEQVQPKSPGTYRILALDQASHITGYAIFDNKKLINYGTFNANGDDEIVRSNTIKNWLLSMIKVWNIDQVGLEGIQYQDSVAGGAHMGITVFQTLARLQGILMEACYENGISYEVCPTNTWRHECGVLGKTRSDRKRSMQLIVKRLYDVTVSDDIADAVGIGIYLSNRISGILNIENWEE